MGRDLQRGHRGCARYLLATAAVRRRRAGHRGRRPGNDHGAGHCRGDVPIARRSKNSSWSASTWRAPPSPTKAWYCAPSRPPSMRSRWRRQTVWRWSRWSWPPWGPRRSRSSASSSGTRVERSGPMQHSSAPITPLWTREVCTRSPARTRHGRSWVLGRQGGAHDGVLGSDARRAPRRARVGAARGPVPQPRRRGPRAALPRHDPDRRPAAGRDRCRPRRRCGRYGERHVERTPIGGEMGGGRPQRG